MTAAADSDADARARTTMQFSREVSQSDLLFGGSESFLLAYLTRPQTAYTSQTTTSNRSNIALELKHLTSQRTALVIDLKI